MTVTRQAYERYMRERVYGRRTPRDIAYRRKTERRAHQYGRLAFQTERCTGDEIATVTLTGNLRLEVCVKRDDDSFDTPEDAGDSFDEYPVDRRVEWHGRTQKRCVSVLTEAGRQWASDNHEQPTGRFRADRSGAAWYTSAYTPFERARDYSRREGMARHDAWLKAWQAVRDEAEIWGHMESSGVIVTLYDGQREVAREGLWGCSYNEHDSYTDIWAYLYEVIADLFLEMQPEIDAAIERSKRYVAERI